MLIPVIRDIWGLSESNLYNTLTDIRDSNTIKKKREIVRIEYMLNSQYSHHYYEIKYFLVSYRALSDAQFGLSQLAYQLKNTEGFYLGEWKTRFAGITTLLRTSIDAFRVDKRSCINSDIRKELDVEWTEISNNKEKHKIFWQFLKKERDQMLHEYHWSAYQAYLDQDGAISSSPISFLTIGSENKKPVLMMRHGPYEGRNCIDLMEEAAKWVEDRIFSCIRRAGFDPDERRNIYNFQKEPNLPQTLLGGDELNTVIFQPPSQT